MTKFKVLTDRIKFTSILNSSRKIFLGKEVLKRRFGEKICPGGKCEYALSERIIIPCRPRWFLKTGDTIMFFYYDDDNRFYEIQAEDIEE